MFHFYTPRKSQKTFLTFTGGTKIEDYGLTKKPTLLFEKNCSNKQFEKRKQYYKKA